jgi:hypothetical protein
MIKRKLNKKAKELMERNISYNYRPIKGLKTRRITHFKKPSTTNYDQN